MMQLDRLKEVETASCSDVGEEANAANELNGDVDKTDLVLEKHNWMNAVWASESPPPLHRLLGRFQGMLAWLSGED